MFRLDHCGNWARLTLDRPQTRNAIALDGWDAFARRLDEAVRSDARLLVVAGVGGAFCAGADLGDFPLLQTDESERARFRTAMRAAIDSLAEFPRPTLAWIDGACFGAGVALALACDLRAAGPNARFAITPARYGIGYPQQDVHRLTALVGRGQAARLLFTADTIDAAEAARIGLVELLADDGAAEALAAAIAANAPESLHMLKRALGLAAAGVDDDEEQDRRFDALFGGAALARRLEASRRK